MVKIRLSRTGVRRKAFYRIVAINERQKAKGVPLENLGYWEPKRKVLKIDKAKVIDWVGKGAVLSPAVAKLLKG